MVSYLLLQVSDGDDSFEHVDEPLGFEYHSVPQGIVQGTVAAVVNDDPQVVVELQHRPELVSSEDPFLLRYFPDLQ